MEEIDRIRPAVLLASTSRGQGEAGARASPVSPGRRTDPVGSTASPPGAGPADAAAGGTPIGTTAGSGPIDAQQRAEKALNALLKDVIGDRSEDRRLRVFKDDDSGRFVYQSVNSRTGEIVRQFPPEEILKLVAQLRDVAGIVLDDRV